MVFPFTRPSWLSQKSAPSQAERLYAHALAQARSVALFDGLGVPDTLDGRFDALCLHVALVLRRLAREDGAENSVLIQGVYDAMFADMDRTLREMGVGDLGVGKRVRRMAEGLMGRAKAYGQGLDAQDDELLVEALRRNLFGTVAAPDLAALQALAGYVRANDRELMAQDLPDLIDPGPRFAPLPAGTPT